jgi:hypothetical protein
LWHLYVWKGHVASEWHPHYHDTMIYYDSPCSWAIHPHKNLEDTSAGSTFNMWPQLLTWPKVSLDVAGWTWCTPMIPMILSPLRASTLVHWNVRLLSGFGQAWAERRRRKSNVQWLYAVFDTLWQSVDGKVWESHAKMISECYDSSLFLGCSQHRRSVWGVNLINQDDAFNVPRTCWRHPALSHFLDLLTHSSCVAL